MRQAKLTPAQIREILVIVDAEPKNMVGTKGARMSGVGAIARRYGVSTAYISQLRHRAGHARRRAEKALGLR